MNPWDADRPLSLDQVSRAVSSQFPDVAAWRGWEFALEVLEAYDRSVDGQFLERLAARRPRS